MAHLAKQHNKVAKSALSAKKKEEAQKQAAESKAATAKQHQDEEEKKRATTTTTMSSKELKLLSPCSQSVKRNSASPTSSVSSVVTQGEHQKSKISNPPII